jgi:Alpha/beta hydrolase family
MKFFSNFKVKKYLIGIALVLVILVLSLSFFLKPAKATELEFAKIAENKNITLENKEKEWIIRPTKSTANLVFITGGLVEEKAYLYKLSLLSIATETTIYVPKILFNLAFFDQGAISRVVKNYSLANYSVAGHSLGGVVACYYVRDNQNDPELKGLILMASYCDKEIPDYKGYIISIQGTQDGVVQKSKKDEADKKLPSQAKILSIEGANHASFGNYGSQKGDNQATISDQEALDKIITLIYKNKNL